MREKEHCCWCIAIADGVLLVGIYGTCFHAGLLVIQCTYGPTLTPAYPLDPNSDTVLHPILVLIHIIGTVVNLLLVFGACTSKRVFMIPWLFGQGALAGLLASLALYYLLLYPGSACPGSNSSADCTLLLWHSVIMVLSLLLLLYYVYVVVDFFGQLRSRQERDKRTLENMITIEEQDKIRREERNRRRPVDWQHQVLTDSALGATTPKEKKPSVLANPAPPPHVVNVLREEQQQQRLHSPFSTASGVGSATVHHEQTANAAMRTHHLVDERGVNLGVVGAHYLHHHHHQQQHQQPGARGDVTAAEPLRDGYKLLSVLPAPDDAITDSGGAASGGSHPYYANQQAAIAAAGAVFAGQNHERDQRLGSVPHDQQPLGHMQSRVSKDRSPVDGGAPIPPPRPQSKKPSFQGSEVHYENAGYEVDSGDANVTAASDRSGRSTSAERQTPHGSENADQSMEEKKKKRVRIFDPGTD